MLTSSGVRLRRRHQRAGALDWLLLPGGPGLGAESLFGLADVLDVPGNIWMVDLPGDGSNTHPNGVLASFDGWPDVLVEAARAVSRPVFVGHSTGGMYLLSVPELESCLAGMALVSSAPDARWRKAFFEMTQAHPLPGVVGATKVYETEKSAEALRDLAVESAEWNFLPTSLEAGRELLRRLPYCVAAVDWSDANFDETYASKWWPQTLPTLVVSGAEDRIVDQSLWSEPSFHGPNVGHHVIDGAAHFPWFENPSAVRAAFRDLAERIGEA